MVLYSGYGGDTESALAASGASEWGGSGAGAVGAEIGAGASEDA